MQVRDVGPLDQLSVDTLMQLSRGVAQTSEGTLIGVIGGPAGESIGHPASCINTNKMCPRAG